MNWNHRHTVLLLCTAAFFSTAFARFVISPVVPAIRAEFTINNTAVGVALTGMWFAYAVSQYPSGVFAGRFGERRLVLGAIGGTAVASLAIVLAPSYWPFLLGAVVLGGVSGLHFSVAATLLSRKFENTGTALGLHNAGGPAAGLVAPVVAAAVGVTYGWRYAVLTGAVLGAVTFALFAWFVRPIEPKAPERPIGEQFTRAILSESLLRPSILFSLGLATVSMFAWQANVSFLPTFLVEHRGMSQTEAGVVFSAYFVAQGVLQVGVGSIADHRDSDSAIALCLAASALGFGVLVAVPGWPGLVAGIAALGVGLSSQVAVMTRILEELSGDEKNTGFGLIRTIYLCVASLGSVVVGLLADSFDWAVAVGFLVALSTLALVAVGVNRTLELEY